MTDNVRTRPYTDLARTVGTHEQGGYCQAQQERGQPYELSARPTTTKTDIANHVCLELFTNCAGVVLVELNIPS